MKLSLEKISGGQFLKSKKSDYKKIKDFLIRNKKKIQLTWFLHGRTFSRGPKYEGSARKRNATPSYFYRQSPKQRALVGMARSYQTRLRTPHGRLTQHHGRSMWRSTCILVAPLCFSVKLQWILLMVKKKYNLRVDLFPSYYISV